MSLTRAQRNYLDYQFADVTAAKAVAEEEEKKRREEEEKKRKEEERRRQEEERQRQEEERRREEGQHREEQQTERRGEQRQPQSLEEETALIKQRLEGQRRRQEEEERRRREEEERRRREEEERRRREEEERKRQEERHREEEERRWQEERRRREEEERRRREEEERRRQEEEQHKRQEELRRQQEELRRQQPLTVDEESEIIRRTLEERSRRQQQVQQVASGASEGGDKGRDGGDGRGSNEEGSSSEEGDRRRIDFDDVVKLLREARDPKKAVEKLREMGNEVEEVSESTGGGYTYQYGWVVRIGDRYIAIASGHRIGRGDVGDYAVMELPDRWLARNFLVGRYWGSLWGNPEFVKRVAETVYYEKELDRWMREELGKAGYTVERIDWGPNAATPGFTYVIRDRDGNKIGEVQVAKIGNRHHLINTGLPSAVMATNDPRRVAAYFVYRHETGDENLAWRLVTGDERAKELYESKVRYEQELKAREEWFRELTRRGLKPIAYSRVNGRSIVSENDLWLDEKTSVTYKVALERQDGKITMRLVPASERDERLLALRRLEQEGFKVIDNKTVEKDGVRYVVNVEERDGKKTLRLGPHPEDAKRAVEREVWWELWRQGFVKRDEYAVKDGVKYRVEVEERDGKYVAKLTPVGLASPEEEPRRNRRGDQRGSLELLRQIQFTIEKFDFERALTPEELAKELRFSSKGRPKDVPHIPVVDEAFYGAFGVPLSQAVFHPAGRELYWRHTTATLPGPRVQGFTLPESQALERVEEVQRRYAEKFSDVWTPLTFRAPTERDIGWRTAAATAAETFTFWIPVAKGAAALAAARGVKVPGLTVEKTAAAGRAVKLSKVPGDYFEIHYVEPRKLDKTVRGVFVGQGVGEGAAIRGAPGHWETVVARSAGKPAPGWAFEFATVAYRDVAEWLKRVPSIGIKTEVKPKALRFTEVRGFARDLEPSKFETLRFEGPKPKGREVKVEWAETRELSQPRAAPERPPAREPPKSPEPEPPRASVRAEEVQRTVAKVAQVEELVRPVRAELPVAQPVRSQLATAPNVEKEVGRAETQRVSGETPFVAPVKAPAPAWRALERALEERELTWPATVPLRELGFVYTPATWSREFATPLTYQFEIRTIETPVVPELERERELETRYDVWTAETPGRATRTADAVASGRRAGGGFAPPPPPPYVVRGWGGGGREIAHALQRPARLYRRGWRVYELLRI